MDQEEIIQRAYAFFSNYYTDDKLYYIELLKDHKIYGTPFILNYAHLSAYDSELAEELINHPLEVIPALEQAVTLLYQEHIFEEPKEPIKVKISNLPKTILVKDLSPKHINKLIQVEGIVVRARAPEDFPETSVFICKDCGNPMTLIQKPYGSFIAPTRCDVCGSKSIELSMEKSKWIPLQVIRIQDLYENLTGNEMPRQVEVILLDDLTNKVNAGDKVRITAIYVIKDKKKEKGSLPTFQKILLANHIEKANEDYERIQITEEDERKILELAKDPQIVEKIVDSIAPEIYGYREVKKGLALALFGGVTRTLPSGVKLRGLSHVLLVGDPGLAKSQLLKAVTKISPRSIYTSGKGSSQAGLTASAIKDEFTGSWILEAGVLVLADGGIAAIDEFEKMSEKDRSAIHEAMEQNTVSISKAGITATLNARTTVIAAANPKYGRFDRNKLLTEQLDLPPTLLSRFDLIFLMLDDPDPIKDAAIAKHIFEVRQKEDVSAPIPMDLLKKYIAYARRNIKPKFTKEAMDLAIKYYVNMRVRAKKQGQATAKPIPITARQLEAIIRLSEARAKMRLSNIVEPEDVEDIIKLLEYTWKMILIDPETGEIDFMILETGKSSSEIEKVKQVREVIKALDDGEGVELYEIYNELKPQGFTLREVEDALRYLMKEGELIDLGAGKYRLKERDI